MSLENCDPLMCALQKLEKEEDMVHGGLRECIRMADEAGAEYEAQSRDIAASLVAFDETHRRSGIVVFFFCLGLLQLTEERCMCRFFKAMQPPPDVARRVGGEALLGHPVARNPDNTKTEQRVVGRGAESRVQRE